MPTWFLNIFRKWAICNFFEISNFATRELLYFSTKLGKSYTKILARSITMFLREKNTTLSLKFSRNLTLSEKGAFFARIRHCGEPSSASPELKLGIPTNFKVLVPIQVQKTWRNGVKYEFQNVSESSCPFSFPGDKIKGDKAPCRFNSTWCRVV